MPILTLGGVTPRIAASAFIAPGAYVIGDVTIGEEASIWYNAVLRADLAPIVIGAGSNIQDNATLHVDLGFPVVIGDDVVVGHNAMVHGATIEDGCLIGMNSTMLSGSRIGNGGILGANSLVSEGKQIESGHLAVGAPARLVRETTETERHRVRTMAASYRALAEEHREAREAPRGGDERREER